MASAAPRPLGSLSAAFHHAERAPRVTSSLTAESPTIQKLQNILGVDIGILATQIMRARKTRKEKMAEGTDLTTHELVQLQRNAFEISWLSSEKREAFVNILDDYAAKHVHS